MGIDIQRTLGTGYYKTHSTQNTQWTLALFGCGLGCLRLMNIHYMDVKKGDLGASKPARRPKNPLKLGKNRQAGTQARAGPYYTPRPASRKAQKVNQCQYMPARTGM